MRKQKLKPNIPEEEWTIEEYAWILILKEAYQTYLNKQEKKNGN